ncbi:putative histidine kinase [Megalodesulfovibrio gigas DSM 1382 = ATCC 19364]|uniref:histidine kinase n=1 Tax=Megalodesulfovibrio gigas (strain ATCC 19364 / DSM 1382 / NCIMB 9332 / VKM B-1759) TaxID=1121448 RepID=T2GB38_MEGG1|nr:putative histidine kinase [Megalodesulfovibrio gigas DSM 1382 = ATCC 19364]
MLEQDSVVREANALACECFCLPKGVLEGQRLSQFVRPEYLYAFKELLSCPWDQRIPLRGEVAFRAHNGRSFLGRLEVRRMTMRISSLEADTVWLCALQDVTEEQRTRQALLEAKQSLATAVQERTVELEQALAELQQEVEKRKTAYRGMAESRAHYHALFHSNAVGIALLTREGVIVEANEALARLLDQDIEALQGRRMTEFLSAESHAGEHRLRSASGAYKWVSISCRCIDSDQPNAGEVWVMQDISRQKELEILKKEVDRILYHDLRGPVAAIHSLSRLYASDTTFSGSQQPTWEIVSSASKRLLDMINSSTDLYHIELGDFHFVPQPCDLFQILRSLREELLGQFQGRDTDIRVLLHGRPVDGELSLQLACMPHLYATMLFNLLLNALEAAPPGSMVTVDVAVDVTGYEIAIHNPGAVPAPIRSRFFEKYVTHGKRGGTGLGTYSARRITEAHGGRIELDTSEETGTTVRLRFPLPGPGRL